MTERIKMLEGLVVVDLGAGMAAALVAKYLAENGARVIRVESAAGDPFYEYYPAYALWHRGAERNQAAERDPVVLNQLLAEADICIAGGEDFPGFDRRQDVDAIARLNPQLVVLEITGNPQGIKNGGRPSTDLLVQARSGLCYEQYSDRPVAMSFQPATYGAVLQGLSALLAAVYERETSGLGQMVRTSLFEGALTWTGMLWGDFEHPTINCSISPKDPFPLIFRCADGVYIHLVIGATNSKYKLYQVLDIDDPSVKPGDSGLPDPTAGPRNYYGDIDLLSEHIGRYQSAELLTALWNEGLPAEPVLRPGECWDHPQVKCNGMIVRDENGTRRVGNPLMARANKAAYRLDKPVGKRPLEGVRIVDVGAFVAGPLASCVLSDLGADVVKVEPIGGEPSRAAVRGYVIANRGKKGVSINLKSADGLKLLQELAKNADVVTSNFRSGVSARLGIDPASLHAVKPDLIVLESPGYGAEGPLAERGAFDLVMQAFCGHEARAAGPGNTPFWNRTFMVDIAGGYLGAIGLLTGLIYRCRSGNGVELTMPLLNAGMFLLCELIQLSEGQFVGADSANSSRTGSHPTEAIYATKDGWLAIVARGDAAAALAEVLGLGGQVPIQARQWADAQAGLIAQAVAQWATVDLIVALERAGVWAEACVTDGGAVLTAEPAFEARGTVRVTYHARFGRMQEIGCLYGLSRSTVGSESPLHEIGEHTREVLRGLHFEDEKIDALLAKAVVADSHASAHGGAWERRL